jgi:hypothetical protein
VSKSNGHCVRQYRSSLDMEARILLSSLSISPILPDNGYNLSYLSHRLCLHQLVEFVVVVV